MKSRLLMTSALFALAVSASAQIQLLYLDEYGRDVIDRNKKLYWMDGDDDPCFDILNYKRTGNKETFTIKSKEEPDNVYQMTITLNPTTKGPVELTRQSKNYGKQTYKVKTTSGDAREDERVYTYFKGLAGYPAATATKVETPATPVKATAVETDAPAETPAAEEATPDKKVKDAARNAVGKVKGLFKKKK